MLLRVEVRGGMGSLECADADVEGWSLWGELMQEESESILDLDLELGKGEEPEAADL